MPCGHGVFSLNLVLDACAAGDVEVMLSWLLLRGEERQGLYFERRFVCPAGTRAFLYFSLGRLRRGQGGVYVAQLRLQKSKTGLVL